MLLEMSQDCIKILDKEGRLIYLNKGGMKVMEIDDLSACLDNDWVDFWTGSGKIAAQKSVALALKGESSKFADFCTTAKGTPKWWEVSLCPICDEKGDVEFILACSHEISQRVFETMRLQQLAGALNSSSLNISTLTIAGKTGSSPQDFSALLELAVSSSEDMIEVFDCDLNYVTANEKACVRLGKTLSEISGKNVLDLFPHIIASQNHRHLLTALNGSQVNDDVREPLGADWYTTLYKPMVYEGKVIGVIVRAKKKEVHRNAVRLEQEIRELKERTEELDDFIENAALAMNWVNGSGIIIWANQFELDLLGYSREEYIGRHIANFHADQEVVADILQRLINKETLINYPARLLTKKGAIKRVLINSNVFWRNGDFVHTRCFTRELVDSATVKFHGE